jgi:hypothetical protein
MFVFEVIAVRFKDFTQRKERSEATKGADATTSLTGAMTGGLSICRGN